MLRAFSTRRGEIEAALAKRGASSARAAEIAALDTRKAKDYGISAVAMIERWRTQAAELGVEADAMDAVVGRTHPRLVVRGEIDRTIETLVGPDGLTAHASSFDRRAVLRAWCEHFAGGAPVRRIEQFADETIAAPQIVPLRVGNRRRACIRVGAAGGSKPPHFAELFDGGSVGAGTAGHRPGRHRPG